MSPYPLGSHSLVGGKLTIIGGSASYLNCIANYFKNNGTSNVINNYYGDFQCHKRTPNRRQVYKTILILIRISLFHEGKHDMKNGLQVFKSDSFLKKILMISVVSGMLAATSAFAAVDINWTGFHIDAGVGLGMLNQDTYVTEFSIPITARETSGGKGVLGRVGVGYNYEWCHRFVLGALADFDFMNVYGKHDFPGVVGTEKQTYSWYLGALAGYKFNPLSLFFIDAGYTNTHLRKVNYQIAVSQGGDTGLTLASHNYNGGFLGLGLETLVSALKSSNLFLRTEYRFSYYKSANIPLTGDEAGIFVENAAEHSRVASQTFITSLRWAFL